MSQLLVMPINRAIISASYKTKGYQLRFKTVHYGVDMYSNNSTIVYACGVGKVLAAQHSKVVGNTVAIEYKNVWDGKKVVTLAVRCFHLRDIMVKVGQNVTKDTIIGHFGSTGMYVKGAHLHIEIDSDYEHWRGVPGLWPTPSDPYYRGGDTMVDPCDILHPYTKDWQTIAWNTARYQGYPFAIKKGYSPVNALTHDDTPPIDYKKKYEDEVKAHEETKKKLHECESNLSDMTKKYDDARESAKIFENKYNREVDEHNKTRTKLKEVSGELFEANREIKELKMKNDHLEIELNTLYPLYEECRSKLEQIKAIVNK